MRSIGVYSTVTLEITTHYWPALCKHIQKYSVAAYFKSMLMVLLISFELKVLFVALYD